MKNHDTLPVTNRARIAEVVMCLSDVGRRVRVVRQPERSEPFEVPAEPVREAPVVEPREPVKV